MKSSLSDTLDARPNESHGERSVTVPSLVRLGLGGKGGEWRIERGLARVNNKLGSKNPRPFGVVKNEKKTSCRQICYVK